MVLAAGIGSRLRPLTDTTPKALVDVGGVAMLERTIRALVAAGVERVVVNTFHLADKVESFLKSKDFGASIDVSHEDVLRDTGGGVLNAARFLDDGKPFFVHNVDILTEDDLRAMYREHELSGALATLACSDR